jgi:hypothetical protein
VSKLAFLAATAVAATTAAGAGGGAVAATRGTASGRETALYDRSQKLINWTHARCSGVDVLLPASCGSTLPWANSPGALPPDEDILFNLLGLLE